MTTAELIEKLQQLDPEGTREVLLETDGSGHARIRGITRPSDCDWITIDG